MSIKRILAAAAASVVAVSAMAVAASADALLTSVVSGESKGPGVKFQEQFTDDKYDADTLAKVEKVVATVTSTAFVNGGIGGNTVKAAGWAQNAGNENSAAGTTEWVWDGVGGLQKTEEGGDLEVQLWWQNVNDDGTDSTVTIDKVELLDASGAVLYTFGGGAAAPAPAESESKPEESKTEETKPNVDTGVEGVAAVVGVAAVAAGALVVAKKRK